MYAEDSFYTLSLAQRMGLLTLTAVLILLVLGIAIAVMRKKRGTVRLATATLLFSLFAWVSPQAYYAYYQMIFDGLPAQIVIGAPPTLDALLGIVTFTGPGTLSAHGLGALFWALVWLAWWLRPIGLPDQAKPDRDP
ncbi:hypothetical protein C1J03_23230 [Sulfitobacter sp. SK012]|uniref:hypothetical protein n=1 Tax=Sulfitobacter sp. SK012 TaxID=1389005 RepID=UPI000E0B6AB2|nr:hypothetical protein [Sulfitobacter sp. SK012]AXI48656.1 hypothetical protein C1J03_23230 [Sulfitobacter sp. SK012]